MTVLNDLRPGDVLVIADKKATSFFVKLAALFTNKPALYNHIAIVHHIDDAGTVWCVEGRPSGTGWVDAEKYLKAPFTKTNAHMYPNRTDEQRSKVASIIEGMIGTPYDWSAIVEIGMNAIHADELWKAKQWNADEVPTHVICSSLAEWAYQQVGWTTPAPYTSGRFVTPADWHLFLEDEEKRMAHETEDTQ